MLPSKNKAKCKLCNSIIESFHRYDYVSCKCGEISIDGGNDFFIAYAKDFTNFLRVDEDDKEISVVFQENDKKKIQKENEKNSKEDLLNMLDEMVKNLESLPQNAMITPVNHYDLCSALLLISSIFRKF